MTLKITKNHIAIILVRSFARSFGGKNQNERK